MCHHTMLERECPDCTSKSRVEYRRLKLEAKSDRQIIRTEGCRQYVRSLKESTPCSDCGSKHPWYVMEFDHVDRQLGDSSVSTLVGHASIERLDEEIRKCDLVCANCHRVRTFTRAVEKGKIKI